MRGGLEQGLHALALRHARRLAQRGGEVRLQRRHGHAAVLAGVDAVARVRAAHGSPGLRQAPVAWHRQPGRRIGQRHLVEAAASRGALQQHGLEHGL